MILRRVAAPVRVGKRRSSAPVESHSETIQQIAARERRQLASDLHDGLAQDLAFIAVQAEHLFAGEDQPIVIAARRALSVLRGTIIDLSASDAPSTAQALRMVGDELAHRHGITVDVRCQGPEVSADDRVELVRIMREAVVNAVHHGDARHVWVTLSVEGGGLRMRVDDDGTGIEQQDGAAGGFGLQSMYERSSRLGGHLSARRRKGGGTAVEVVVA